MVIAEGSPYPHGTRLVYDPQQAVGARPDSGVQPLCTPGGLHHNGSRGQPTIETVGLLASVISDLAGLGSIPLDAMALAHLQALVPSHP